NLQLESPLVERDLAGAVTVPCRIESGPGAEGSEHPLAGDPERAGETEGPSPGVQTGNTSGKPLVYPDTLCKRVHLISSERRASFVGQLAAAKELETVYGVHCVLPQGLHRKFSPCQGPSPETKAFRRHNSVTPADCVLSP